MNYRLKSNRANSQLTHFAIGAGLFVFFILLRTFFSTPFSSLSYTVATPLFNFRDMLLGTGQNALNYSGSKESLISENTALKDEVYNLQLKNLELSSRINSLTNSNNTFQTLNTQGMVKAKVLSKPPFAPFDTFILDQGKNSSISVGDKVFIGENILIGTVSETENSFSKVVLFSSGTNQTAINIVRTGQGVTALGQGGGNFLMTLPKDFDIVVGDILIATNSSQSVIASVYSIDSSSQGSFKKVYARIPFNILQSDWVNISTGQ